MTQAIVNNRTFEIDVSQDNISVDGKTFEWDISELGQGRFHIIKDNKSFAAEIVSIEGKTVALKINNNIYEVELKNKLDLLLEKLGMDNLDTQMANEIKAPMPGLIFDVMVKVGDEVKKGDQVIILEAMKMENVIKSPSDGIVSNVHIEKGQSVEKNSVLISF